MRKILRSICICTVSFGLLISAGCGSDKNGDKPKKENNSITENNDEVQKPKDEENTEISLGKLAQVERGSVGKYATAIYAAPEAKLGDGQVITLNFVESRKYATFKLKSGEELENVVVIRNATPTENAEAFPKEGGYFSIFDSYGEEQSEVKVWTQSGNEYTDIILGVDDLLGDKVMYYLVGGLDEEKHQGGRLIFKINK